MPEREERIRVNGRELPLAGTALVELLAGLGYDGAAAGIAVAVNGEVVARSSWGERRLQPGDEVEVVGAVQGG